MVDVLGTRAIPGHPVEWLPPMDGEVWRALTAEWSEFVGQFDGVAVCERAQVSRRGFAALLLSDGHPIGFVKARDGDDAPPLNEFRALTSINSAEPVSFEVPQPVAVASVHGWHYLLTTALRPNLHRMPVEPPLRKIAAEIQSGLKTLPRPAGTPQHWEPMHGDFTPWNLRQQGDGSLFLIDWEDAGWAPPGADEVYYRAVIHVLGAEGGAFEGDANEANRFWQDRIRVKSTQAIEAGDADSDLGEALLLHFGLNVG
jgi:hypothetical protein